MFSFPFLFYFVMPKNIQLEKELMISFLKNKIKNSGNFLRPRRKVPLLLIYHLLHLGRILASLWAKSNGLSHMRAYAHTYQDRDTHMQAHSVHVFCVIFIYFLVIKAFAGSFLAAPTTIYLQLK